MGIPVMLLSLIVLGFLYRRMIARGLPEPIGRKQAIVPVLYGFAALLLSLVFTYSLEYLIDAIGYTATDYDRVTRSVIVAFYNAGFTEELAKFLMILAVFRRFRSTVTSVYEYMLIGAGVGLGFTLPEEFLYLFSPEGLFFRIMVLAGHPVYGIITTYYLGLAYYKKITLQGSPAKEYILALFLPVLMHTLYDAGTGFNAFLDDEDEDLQLIGVVIGLVVILAAFVIQIMILRKFKKNAPHLCSLRLLPGYSL